MHTAFKQDLDKHLINGVIQCIEMMKAMEESYNKRSVTLNNFSFIMEKYYLQKVKEKLKHFKGLLNAVTSKKDVVLMHLTNILEVAYTNVSMGFNQS